MGTILTGMVVVGVAGIWMAWQRQKKKAEIEFEAEVDTEIDTEVEIQVEATGETEVEPLEPSPVQPELMLLLADDSIAIHKVVELLFMEEDYKVVIAANGAEAISHLADTRFDIVLTDVHMPGKNGYEVCEYAKSLYPEVPVILLVGFFETFDDEAYGRCGASDVVKKPFDSQDLLHRVDKFAAEKARSE